MANITAAEVNKLRQQTGAGMMDCKNALVEADGDYEKAIDYLRKKGQKLASNRADRDANEGIVLAKTSADNKKAFVIMLNCETDFVAKNQDFINFADNIMAVAIEKSPKSLEELKTLEINGRSIDDTTTDLIGKIGEKLQLAHYEFVENEFASAYNHHGNRLATIVSFNKNVAGIDEMGREVAKQIAAMNPVAVDKDSVDPKTIEKEIEIGKDLARQEGKAEEMVEKIALGKLNKFFKENTLLSQEFIKDNKITVGQYLANADKDLTATAFKRLMLGA
ncbi:MAG: elongation factor Ts [Bacteroidetes bacterium]|nr:elongation factor Ts [Bacteroidota bacterium]